MNKIFFYLIISFLFFFIYIFLFLNYSKVEHKNNIIKINKGSSVNQVVNQFLLKEHIINKQIFSYYLTFISNYYKPIKYGEFKFEGNESLISITKIITNPSNHYRNITIIGGWQKYQLQEIFNKKFNEITLPDYSDIIADTYNYKYYDSINEVIKLMKDTKNNFFLINSKKKLLQKYSIKEIMIISSLVEKEGKTDQDKRLISSVIFNRLNKNMKLEIDATTIYSITKGEYKLDRSLLLEDLKIKDVNNTYYIRGLPPNPICYVSRKTIEIVLENYKSDFLFYFFDTQNDKHIFTKTFKEHKKHLTKYRNSE